jgi:catechol 2,3-dioxygenase-like lactoylglutathione lyase family enzyme
VTAGLLDGINHVGMAVRDLGVAAARLGALGFQLTPYSPHSAAWKPGEAVKPLGSGNRCVMFRGNYLEVLGSEDPRNQAARIAGFLARHQGAHIICFDGEDLPGAERRLAASGLETSGILPLQREVDTPEGPRTARFERLQFAPGDSPEGYIQVARHLTPEFIYQPRHCVHANGAEALSDTTLVADDLDRFVATYARYAGFGPAEAAEGRAVFRFASGQRLTILDLPRARAALPGTLMPAAPCIAAVAFRCRDVAEAGRVAASGGATVLALPDGRLMVPAEEASGLAILFEPRA